MIVPPCRSTTMRRAMSRPRPVPLPTSLVVKNASNARAATSGGMPGPVSPISTTTSSPSAAVATRSVPGAVHRVDGVVDQVGPHLVELAGVRLDRRHVGAVVAHHRDAVAELVAEHHQRALEALGHVDRAAARRGPSASRTGPRRPARRSAGSTPSPRPAAWRPRTCSPPTPAPGSSAGPVEHVRDPLAPGDVDPGGGQRRGDRPLAARRRGRPASPTAPPRGRRAPAGRGRAAAAARPRGAGRRARRTGRPRSRRRRAGRATTAASGRPSSSASTARVAAAAGLLISCASPAASVPSVTSASRCRAVDSMVRAVRYRPSMRCPPNGNHASGQLAQHLGRHPEHPARGRRRGRSRGRRRARPRPGSRRPSGPGTSIRPTTVSSRPMCRTSSIAPSTSTHQKSACSPSRNSSTPGSIAHLGAGRDQLGELVVGQPVEEGERPQVLDAHQIVAR